MAETAIQPVELPPPFPDHTQLPESDGTFVKNFQEHPQSIILTDSIGPVLQRLHPDGRYAIGQDCGIYWRETEPPEQGAVAPDWFYVPNVPPLLDGQFRRSFVLWREYAAPLIALEFASGNGAEERDSTPLLITDEGEVTRPGKFWVYEQIIRIPYYGIYEVSTGKLEFYHLTDFSYRKLVPNERGRYPIPPLDVELGLWQGTYQQQEQQWLRWWDLEGHLLLIGQEQAEREKQRAEQAEQQAQQEKQRAEQAEQQAQQEKQRAEQAEQQAQQEKQRAEQAEQRADQSMKAQQQEVEARREAIPRLLELGLSVAQVAEALGLAEEEVRQQER